MKVVSVAWLIVSVALAGCGREAPESAKAAPKAKPASLQSISAELAPPPAAALAPPPDSPGARPQAAPPQAMLADGTVGAPTGLSELGRLNWALEMYHVAHIESPPLANFDPLIKAKLIKEVPPAPPGKKFVLDGKRWEVRLENAK